MNTQVMPIRFDDASAIPPDEATDLAQKALTLALKYDIPPVPKAFDVFFAYVAGTNDKVCQSLDGMLASKKSLGSAVIDELHSEYLSPRAMGEDLAEISDNLGSELAKIMGAIETGMDGSSTFSDQVRATIKQLSTNLSKDELKKVATQLHRSNRDQLSTALEVNDNLSRSRNRVAAMEKELVELRQSALTDHLTQLPNRRCLDETLDAAIELARSNGQPLAVALADIDKFKAVNDNWGHSAGDNILRRFGKILKSNVKGRDTPARYGGEEFALVLPETDLMSASALTNQIRKLLEEIEWKSQKTGEMIGTVTVSFGVTVLRGSDSKSDVLSRADKLLYKAKDAGRNRCVAGE